MAEGSGVKGWAPAANVILFDQAIDYITNQIRANPGPVQLPWRANLASGSSRSDYNGHPARSGVRTRLTTAGNAWIAKKDYDKAIADYNEAIRLDPGYALAYYNRGVAFLLTGSEKAGDDERKFLELEGWRGEYSQYAVLWGYFGSRRAGKAEAARRFLDEAAAKCDTAAWLYPVIRYLRGEIDAERPAHRGNRYRQDDRGPMLPGARPGPQGKGRHGQRALPLGRGARYSHLHRVHDRRGRVGAIGEGESAPRKVIVVGAVEPMLL